MNGGTATTPTTTWRAGMTYAYHGPSGIPLVGIEQAQPSAAGTAALIDVLAHILVQVAQTAAQNTGGTAC